jgi:glyoxylase-like metal-dependent hydrolase (beta-lactamase superfamily II)
VPLAGRAAGQPARLSSTSLGTNLILLSGLSGNLVILGDGGSGSLLVNGGAPPPPPPDEGLGLGAGAQVQFLFNTDWHPEHTAMNQVVGQRGGQILAHEFTKQYLSIDRYVEWRNNTMYKALPAKALPTKTFTKPGSMMFGGQTIEYAPLGQAHTDGDIYVFFRDANVLVVGDMMTAGKYPIADYTSGGWLGGLVTATKALLDISKADTRIVGEGPVQTRADLQAQYDMLSASRDVFVKMMRQGMSADDMLAAGATKAFDAKWGDPKLFVKTSYRSLWLHVREVGGIV